MFVRHFADYVNLLQSVQGSNTTTACVGLSSQHILGIYYRYYLYSHPSKVKGNQIKLWLICAKHYVRYSQTFIGSLSVITITK